MKPEDNTPQKPVAENSSVQQPAKQYANNPFFITVDGIKRVFSYARSVAIFMLILSVISAIFNLVDSATHQNTDLETLDSTVAEVTANPTETAIFLSVIFISATIIILASIFVRGITDYTASRTAKGESVTLKQAAGEVLNNFWRYTVVQLLVFIKTLGWTLLFIVPGIYFYYRYSLAGAAFFDQKRSARESVQRSLELTRGAWLTTFASYGIVNVLTIGSVQYLLNTSTTSELYSRYSAVLDEELPHPKVHWLSIVFLAVSILVIFLALTLLATLAFAFYNA
ncbi:hypothetical protein FJZ39_02475 [Candidatus Saccharibacteria bacterium]|nr:hypothetical protein [Candidatus Saccharibacteria bacterium]